MDDEKVGKVILDCAFKVHSALGPGLLESAYEACLAYELKQQGLDVRQQVMLPVTYEKILLDAGYRLDLLVNNRVVIELKAVNKITDLHQAQLISYLKLGDFVLGYLLNFNVNRLKDGIKRVVNGI